ncbi:MAG: hypothetical protein IPM77_09285 [Crocinitomicaceae bacterium]|nr:hypothetical protein [Crocinitomicaceae bacterium]
MTLIRKIIFLAAQSNGTGGFRLGINKIDSEECFKRRGRIVILIIKGLPVIKCKTACGITDWTIEFKEKRKKSYDLNSQLISSWIKLNFPKKWKKGNPPHFAFSIYSGGDNKEIILEYLNQKLPITANKHKR